MNNLELERRLNYIKNNPETGMFLEEVKHKLKLSRV